MVKRTISFNEELHQYTDEDKNIYTSVTTCIKDYEIPFDEKYWLNYKSNELGVSKSFLKKEWDSIRDNSCKLGTVEHKLLEDSVNNSTLNINSTYGQRKENLLQGLKKITIVDIETLKNSPLGKKYPIILNYLINKLEEGFSIFVEKRIYVFEYLVAGTIDCLLIKGKEFIIADWKTNKDELKFKSGYYKKINGIKSNQWVDKKEFFKAPLNTLPFCKGNVYSLQLSLYAYILELWGYKCIDLQLFHIKRDVSVTVYKINYLKQHCQLLLIDFKNRSSLSKPSNNTTNKITKFGIN
ncbi:MAG: hypothetical protein EKK61_03965 [Rickettsiales bacterium]|nr:MAG: hypothetical protein EKK61_03965 [Rickettsiales bacterium]